MQQNIEQYLAHIRNDYRNWGKLGGDDSNTEVRKKMVEEFDASIRVEETRKYFKVITNGSVHSFIVKETGSCGGKVWNQGDILKAASWKAPATNFSRGNILEISKIFLGLVLCK